MLNRQYTEEGLNDLKYAAITIRTKDEDVSATSIYGLLLGYRILTLDNNAESIKTNGSFIWVYRKKCVYLYSINVYLYTL